MSAQHLDLTHPLIPNQEQYMLEKKFVSIHSEDRNIIKYPMSSHFEIELPQDYCNVQAVKLSSWTFPSNNSTFSSLQSNISMTFKITNPWNPDNSDNTSYAPNSLDDYEYNALFQHKDTDYIIEIEEGFYNAEQMVTELTNKFNEAVTVYIYNWLNDPDNMVPLNISSTYIGYNQFVVVYNVVRANIWFGNKSSEFTLTNGSEVYHRHFLESSSCHKRNRMDEYANWGLPSYLGFTHENVSSNSTGFPRFYYGDNVVGDKGYWLLPDPLKLGSVVSYLNAPLKINIFGPAYFYIEIDVGGTYLNCLDETQPFNISNFTETTNETNGSVNSAFAKISIPTAPLTQWYDCNIDSFKLFNPPKDRIRKISIKIRYHNGQLVDFGNFDFSLTFEFALFRPQQKGNKKVYLPESGF